MLRVLLALAALLFASAAFAGVPPVLVPPHADSLGVGAEPAPLIIPGRPNPADSLRPTPARLAAEQYAMGLQLERDGQPAAAIAAYRNAVRFQPALPDAHYRMGRLFSAVAQHKEAAREYEAELARHPDRRDAERALALERAQLSDSTSAIEQLEKLTRSEPGDGASWRALGFAYSMANRPTDSERALRRALELDPRDALGWRDLGVLLASQKRGVEARDAYSRAARLAPQDAGVWLNLGNLERREGRMDAALGAYDEAIRRDSSLAFAWRGRIAVYDDLGRTLEAAGTFRAWLAHQPGDNTLRVEAMQRYDALGRKDIALDLAREGVHNTPKSGAARLALAMALHEAGSERAALLQMRHAQSLMRKPGQSDRIAGLIASMRAHAPDSLRAMFAADSVAHPVRATADSPRRP